MTLHPNSDRDVGNAFARQLLNKPQWLSWLMVAGLTVLVLLFVLSDARELWRTAQQLHPGWLAVSVVCSLASYVAMARSYQGIARAAGHSVPFGEMFKVTIVANTANYLVTTGGLSGFAVRMYCFVQRNIPSSLAVTISLVQTFVTNTVLLLFVVTGFVYLLKAHELRGVTLVFTSALTALFAAATLIAIFLLVHRRVRRRTLFLLAEAGHFLLHRFAPRIKPRRVGIWRFQRNLGRGIEFLLERKTLMIGPLFWIVADWAFTLATLSSAFLAVGHAVPFSFVVVGFAVGIVLSLVSFIPGGLGVMEGSMAAIFAGLGVPLEVAVVAVLIFRVAYYLLPLVISLFVFRSVLVEATRETVRLEPEPEEP